VWPASAAAWASSCSTLSGPAVGGVKDVVAEAGGKFSQLLVGGIEGLLRFAAKADPAQVHIPQFGRQDALLGAIQTPLAL
jgi:hypothetical protein